MLGPGAFVSDRCPDVCGFGSCAGGADGFAAGTSAVSGGIADGHRACNRSDAAAANPGDCAAELLGRFGSPLGDGGPGSDGLAWQFSAAGAGWGIPAGVQVYAVGP